MDVGVVGGESGPTDEDLIARFRTGDAAALDLLLDRYRRFARSKARAYYLVGADQDDLAQEGMIGVYKAVRDFRPGFGPSFRAFAELCVTRQIISAIKAATRYKHGPLNGYVSFSREVPGLDDGERSLLDRLPTRTGPDPADLVISTERLRSLQRHLQACLSDLEAEVLRLYVDGKSYSEIAEMLSRQVKSIDNALQRIKRKLDNHLKDREVAEAG